MTDGEHYSKGLITGEGEAEVGDNVNKIEG